MPQEPLLSDTHSSDRDEDLAEAEEDALLSGQSTQKSKGLTKYPWSFWREVGIFVWAMLATTAVIIIAVLWQHQHSNHGGRPTKPSGKRNMIFMVSDGMGPTSLSLTRSFRQFNEGLPIDDILILDQHLIGTSRTRSSNSLVTDSAAGATAFSCGFKSYNSAISVRPDHSPCGTILEAAKQAGYMTGLVVTTRITDATPACFAAHVNTRSEEDRIAEQEIGNYPLGRVVDLMLGGGRCHFLPNTSSGSCRQDDKDVVAMAKANGFSYIDDRKGFDGLDLGSAVKLPLLGLFAPGDIPYEVDRRNENDIYPSLHEMAEVALKALTDATRDSDKGFFLMIEGSRIDHAGHHNDPVAQVHEVIEYDNTFAKVLKYLDGSDVEGVVVSTSDHETGGLSTARQLYSSYPDYLWLPEVLANASHSAENLARRLQVILGTTPSASDVKSKVNVELVQNGLGVMDATDEELQLIIDHPVPSTYIFANMISRRAQVGWSTHGHSAADVNIYASTGAEVLQHNHENTEIGEFMANYLDLDLGHVTEQLKQKGVMYDFAEDGKTYSWMGELPGDDKHLEEFDHYHSETGEIVAFEILGNGVFPRSVYA